MAWRLERVGMRAVLVSAVGVTLRPLLMSIGETLSSFCQAAIVLCES